MATGVIPGGPNNMPEIHTDKYFRMGASHIVCEDYALAGSITNDFHFALVCDGCSGSDDTDIGARLLAHAFKGVLRDFSMGDDFRERLNIDDLSKNTLLRLSNSLASLNLPVDALDATLIAVLADQREGLLHVLFFGDGFARVKIRDKVYEYSSEFNNYPLYLSYGLKPEALEKHAKVFGDKAGTMTVRTIEGSETSDYVTKIGHYHDVLCLHGMDNAVVSSDGMATFCVKNQDVRNPNDMLEKFSDFKSTKGKFIERKSQKIFRDLAKEGVSPFDDFSLAGISMIERDETNLIVKE
jgi:hypothetical protein